MSLLKTVCAIAILAPGIAQAATVLVNGDFEAATTPPTTDYSTTTTVPGWLTTEADGEIEIWTSGFNGVNSANGPAESFTDGAQQFAEINANEPSTLFQDVTIIESGGVDYSFLHRGRSGADTMTFQVTYLGEDGVFGGVDDQIVFTQTVTDDNIEDPGEFNGWNQYSGQSVFNSVANGEYRFAFTAVSSAGGDNSFGNFLDNATFGVAAVPEPSTLTLLSLAGAAVLVKLRRLRRPRVN